MRKVPVGETISAAYGFAFPGILSVLGTVWFPYMVLAAFCFAVVTHFAPDLPGQVMRGEFDISLLRSFRRMEALLWLGVWIIHAMVTVGLQERALGLVRGPRFFFFSLGAPVWRMVGALLLAMLVFVLIGVLTIAATTVIALIAIWFVPHFGYTIAIAAVVVAICWQIYVIVRLMFFLAAVVVVEKRIGLVRSWELSRGNFWRIVAVFFATYVPVWIGLSIVSSAVMGPWVPLDMFHHLHPGMTPEDFSEFYAALLRRALQHILAVLPFFVAFNVIQELIFLGLGNGAVAKAYLAVAGKAEAL